MRVLPGVLGRWILLLAAACLVCLSGCREDASHPPDVLEQARSAFSRGLYLQAEGAFETFLKNHPMHEARWEAYTRLVDIALSVKNDPERGLKLLEEMLPEFIDRKDRALQILLQTGDLQRASDQPDQAMASWRRAWSLPGVSAKDLAPFSLRIARALRAKGEFSASRDALERCRITAVSPDVQQACAYELALTSTLMDDNQRAISLLKELLQRPDLPDEDRGVAAFLLADIFTQDKRYEEAQKLLTSIRDTHPNPLAVDARLQQLREWMQK